MENHPIHPNLYWGNCLLWESGSRKTGKGLEYSMELGFTGTYICLNLANV